MWTLDEVIKKFGYDRAELEAEIAAETVPNPGSGAALALGCRCPVMDNWRGSDEIGRIRGFVMVADCPLHGFDEERDKGEHP